MDIKNIKENEEKVSKYLKKKQEQKLILEAKLNDLENQKKILMANLKNKQPEKLERYIKKKETSAEKKRQTSNERKQNNKSKLIKNIDEKRENSNSKKIGKNPKSGPIDDEYSKLGDQGLNKNKVIVYTNYFN